MKFLYIGAHPDDIEFSCAGMISKLVSAGDEVGCVVMSAGEGSAAPDNSNRREDQRKVWDLLGVKYSKILDFPDGYMECDKYMISVLAKIICEFSPDVVFTHYPHDRHQDHRTVANAVVSAVGYENNLVFYDSYSSIGFEPNLYFDISGHVERKQNALHLFKSEIEKFEKRGTPFDDVAISRNKKYGHDTGGGYVEAYHVARCVIE